jgi:hypothetical protein
MSFNANGTASCTSSGSSSLAKLVELLFARALPKELMATFLIEQPDKASMQMEQTIIQLPALLVIRTKSIKPSRFIAE